MALKLLIHMNMASDISRVFLDIPIHTCNQQRHHNGKWWGVKFSKFVPPDALKMNSLVLSVFIFPCKTFSRLPEVYNTKYSSLWMVFKKSCVQMEICVVIKLRDQLSSLSWKGAATSAEGITRNSVNYIQRRKSRHSCYLLCV